MKHRIVRIMLPVILSIPFCNITAQVKDTVVGKNIIKLNVPALYFKNISLQYERVIDKKHSFALAVRYRPESSIPFQKTIQDLFTDTTIRLDLAKMGNIGIIPEYRFYIGKKGALHGFYIGPFISYNHYSGDVPVNYFDYDFVNHVSIPRVAVFKGSANTYTAGVQLGAQWELSKRLYLDWWIIGLNYGFNKGDFKFRGALNDNEQIALDVKLGLMKEAISSMINVDVYEHPNANGAAFSTSGKWMGLRALGICLGYRFW